MLPVVVGALGTIPNATKESLKGVKFPIRPFAIYAEIFTLKLLLTCLFISLIELLKFRLASSANWCTLEYFIARSEK